MFGKAPGSGRPVPGGAHQACRVSGLWTLGATVVQLAVFLGVAVLTGAAPPAAAAGLADGRVYEQASAVKKNGNEAGVKLGTVPGKVVPVGAYANSAPDGGAVTYYLGGPAGETSSGADLYSVSRRNPQRGWETSAALPPEVLSNGDYLGGVPLTLLPSADLSRFLFVAFGPFVSANSLSTEDQDLGLYRTRGNSSEPDWLTRPTFAEFSQAKPEPGKIK